MAAADYLLREQVGHVLAALMPSNALVCRVMLHTGLRVGDVLALKPEQIKRSVWVTEAKTGKRKHIGIPDGLAADILAQSSDSWAFPSPRDPSKPRTRQAVWWDIKRAAKAFRLPQNASCHSMRKVYAVDLLRKYGDLARVQKALNHERPEVTLLYAMADKLLDVRRRG